MLGIPVPFSNLGTAIIDLFDYDPLRSNSSLNRMFHKLSALQLNAQQVHRFLHEYSKQSSDLSQLELSKLTDDFYLAESRLQELLSETFPSRNMSIEALSALEAKYVDYLGRVRGLCRSIWSKFDLLTMAVGGVVIVCAFLFNIALVVCETNSLPLSTGTYVAGSAVSLSGMLNLLQLLQSGFLLLVTVFAVALFLLMVFLSIGKSVFTVLPSSNRCFRFVEMFSVLVCASHSMSLLSNSFVVYEDHSTLFLVQSVLLAVLLEQSFVILRRRLSTSDLGAKHRVPQEFPLASVHIVLLVSALVGCTRLSAVFHSCREEQIDCEISWFAQPLSAILMKFEHFRLARLSISVFSVITVIAVATMWLRHCGNLNGLEPSVVVVRYIMPLTGSCLCMYWVVDGFILHNSIGRLVAAGVTALPRLIYILSLASLVVIAVSPLCLLVLRLQQDEDSIDNLRNVSHEERIAQIYGHVRRNWRCVVKTPDASYPVDNTPVVYGLATVYSSGQIVLLMPVAMVMMLVLGDNMAPSIAVLMICQLCLLELHAAYVHCLSDEGYFLVLLAVKDARINLLQV